jgi:hypothetical protein
MSRGFSCLLIVGIALSTGEVGLAQTPAAEALLQISSTFELSDEQTQQLDEMVDRAITYLAKMQNADGSFAAPTFGQPGITSLCCLAMLSAGTVPDDMEYGVQLTRGIDFVLSTQRDDGLFSLQAPEAIHIENGASHAALYNHAMAGLLLTEVYGIASPSQSRQISLAIPPALELSRRFQIGQKRRDVDKGGWKYLRHSPHTPADSDLSVTAWQLMFYRSAKNAQFEVPAEYATDAVDYVNRCFDNHRNEFLYGVSEPTPYTSRGVIGAGIFALAMAGEHNTDFARLAANRLLKKSFQYNVTLTPYEQYHYTIYHCSQAMFQLGDRYWSGYFPPLLKTLAENQRPDGSWPATPGWERLGGPYTVSLTVLALTPSYQLLPIYQR